MKKLVLHIGPQKTATTYIQKLLALHRETFEDQGIHYPNLLFSVFGHHELSRYYTFNHQVAGFADALNKINALQGTVVLSSENLSNAPLDSISRMKQDFAAEETVIVYYLRRPTDRLLSLWHERIKWGERLSFHEFAVPHLANPFSSHILNPLITLDLFSDIFGFDSIALVDYDQATHDQAILKEFFSVPAYPSWSKTAMKS